MINIDLDEIIENMERTDTKVKNLSNGWNIKIIGDFEEYELFNDEENTIISCKNIDELEESLDKQIWVNPETPDYMDFRDLNERSDEHMNKWFNRPFIRTQDFGEDDYKDYSERMKEFGNLMTEQEFNDRRIKDKKQWLEWWPEGKRYDVRILDGGAWDRTTNKGHYKTLKEAIERAKELQGTKSKYQEMMENIDQISDENE